MSSGFVAGTLVHTDKGLVPIQNLKVGDLVWTKDLNNNHIEKQKILNTFEYPETPILYIRYTMTTGNDMGKDGFIFCTEEQKFWTEEFEYAESLQTRKIGWVKSIFLEGCSLHALKTIKNEMLAVTMFEFNFENFLLPSADDKMAWLNNTEEMIGLVDFIGNDFCLVKEFDENIGMENLLLFQKVVNFRLADTFTALQFFNADIKSTSQIYETCVFNLSIEKNQNYFVGNLGILVGDSTIQGNNE